MPDDEELARVRQKAAQAEKGEDFDVGGKTELPEIKLKQKLERPIDVLKRELAKEDKIWEEIAVKLSTLGDMDGEPFKALYHHKLLPKSEAGIDESATPEAMEREIEITQYRAADSLDTGRLYIKQAGQFLERLQAASVFRDALHKESGVQDIEPLLADLNIVVEQAKASLVRVQTVLEQAYWQEQEFKQRLAEREGYDSPKDLERHKSELERKKWQLGNTYLGKWRHKKEIEQLDEEYQQSRKLVNRLYLSEPVKHTDMEAAIKDLLTKIYEAVKAVANACRNRFQLLDATHRPGLSPKSITQIEGVFDYIPELNRQAYREIFRLMPNSETMEQRFSIERHFQKIWGLLAPTVNEVTHGGHDMNMPGEGIFRMWESSG